MDCENSHEKEQTGIILRAQNFFLFATVRVKLSEQRSVFIKMFLKCLLARNMSEIRKKQQLTLTHVNSSLLFLAANSGKRKTCTWIYFLTGEKSHG